MKIIEIKKFENGAHRNQIGDFDNIPEGFAVVPDDMELENFPFGEVTAEEVNGVLTVTGWIPGTIPVAPEPEKPITMEERLAALEAAVLEMALGGAE